MNRTVHAKDLRPGMWAILPKPGITPEPMRLTRVEFGSTPGQVQVLSASLSQYVYLQETDEVTVVSSRPTASITWDQDTARWVVGVLGNTEVVVNNELVVEPQ